MKNWFEENQPASNKWIKTSGTANLTAADTAANGVQFWSAQNLESAQSDGPAYLHSPCFQMQGSSELQISFNHSFQLPPNGKVWVETSENGKDWVKLGTTRSGYNWYNSPDNYWSNGATVWKPASYRIPSASGLLLFRFVFQGQNAGDLINQFQSAGGIVDGFSGDGVFSLDDINIEPLSSVDESIPFSQTSGQVSPDEWLKFGTDNTRAAMVQPYDGLQEANLQMYINRNAIRTYNDRYYLDRNFNLNASPYQAVGRSIRLFIGEEEMNSMLQADQALLNPMKLGIFQYTGANTDLEIANNDFSNSSEFMFIPSSEIVKVPTYGGLYLEFQGSTQAEFYISRTGLVDNTPSAMRMATAGKPPHEPSELKWLTPLDHDGINPEKKIAWLDQGAQMLYLDGLNGVHSRIRLLDVKGQIVLDESFSGFKFQTRTSGLPKGIYTLRLEQEAGSETFRLILN
jgi:hypothetical protein